MGSNRINEASQERRVNNINHELGSLCDGPGGYPCCSNGESPLEEEERIVVSRRRDASEAEEVLADEAVGGGAEGEGKAKEIVEEASGGGIENVGEHDVHGVLGADGAGAEHREAELHYEDEVRGEEQVRRVDGAAGVPQLRRHGVKLRCDVVETAADEGCCGGGDITGLQP